MSYSYHSYKGKEIALRYTLEADTYLSKRPFYKTYIGKRLLTILAFILNFMLRRNISNVVKVANIACGPATHEQIILPLLKRLGKVNYYWISLDISSAMVKKVNNLASSVYHQVDCIVADATHPPFREEAFDLIICSRAIKFMPPTKCFIDFRKLMKKSSLLILVADVADAIWCRLLEKKGLSVDPAIYNKWKTFHSSQILEKLRSARLKVLASLPITSLPLSLFSYKFFRKIMENPFFRKFDSSRIMGSRIILYIAGKVR
jgi:SAM-dependent methyltransferase